MAKTVVEFAVPFVFADEGDYEVKMKGQTAKVKIVLVQNVEMMEKMTGMESEGKVTMAQDIHGIANISKVKIEVPYVLVAIEDRVAGKEVEPEAMSKSLKEECILYLNRLIEIVRWKTRKFWLTAISPRDIFGWNCEVVDDTGKGKRLFMMDFGKGIKFPIEVLEQSTVNEDIVVMLKDEQRVPIADNLILDAVNYFEAGRFNEAVIVMNVALETTVAGYLFIKLIRKGVRDTDALKQVSDIFSEKFHKVMRNYFKTVDGRSLEDDKELWKKFDDARLMRKHALHPRIRELSEEEARRTMDDILTVMNWVMSGMQ